MSIDTYPPQNVSAQTPTLAYAEITSSSTSTTAATTTDIPGLTATVTVPAGRRLRITVKLIGYSNTVPARVAATIRESGVVLGNFEGMTSVAGFGVGLHATAIISPSAGTHTYTGAITATTQTGFVYADANLPCYILVEDITGSQLPVLPQSVPVGVLAQAQNFGGGVTSTVTDSWVSLSTLNVAVPAGRTLRLTGKIHVSCGTAGDRTRIGFRESGSVLAAGYRVLSGGSFGEELMIETLISPAAGAHTYELAFTRNSGSSTHTIYSNANEPTLFSIEDVSPTPAPGQGAPGSTLGYAEVTANQASITTLVDLTGLATTVTVPAGRRIRITGQAISQRSVADGETNLIIREGSTALAYGAIRPAATAKNETHSVNVVLSPSAATHTYKLSMEQGGTGTTTMSAAVTYPAFILVEDITGAVWPVGSTVTAGMVASEQWTPFTPVVKFGATTATLTTNNTQYQKIGRTVIMQIMVKISSLNAGTGNLTVTLPYAVRAPAGTLAYGTPLGSGGYVDGGTGAAYPGFVTPNNVGDVIFRTTNAQPSVVFTHAAPKTVAATDEIHATITYEAVS